MLRVVFRVDSGFIMGSGHLIRCLTLARALSNAGAEVVFVSRAQQGHLIEKIRQQGYVVHQLNPQLKIDIKKKRLTYADWLGVSIQHDVHETLSVLSGQHYDWIIIDHYGIDEVWEKAIREIVTHVLVIDDLANRSHDADFLVDPNYFAEKTSKRYEQLIASKCRCLLGPRYALLQPEYTSLRRTLLTHNGCVRRVLVFFGGSDPTDETSKVLLALNHSNFMHLEIDVVIGVNHPNPKRVIHLAAQRIGVYIYQNLNSLASLMSNVQLSLGAGGGTTWERISLGIPSLVVSIAENQRDFTRILASNGFQAEMKLELLATVDDWRNKIFELISSPNLIKQFSERSKDLVDGLGLKRISRIVLGITEAEINLRAARHDDEKLLLDWVNETEVRAQSFVQKIVNKQEHKSWFQSRLIASDCLILIAEDEAGLSLGQVRFEPDEEMLGVVIDISIDATFRGFGLSSILLRKALNQYMVNRQNVRFIAEIRENNVRSSKLFLKENFRLVASRKKNTKTYELCC